MRNKFVSPGAVVGRSQHYNLRKQEAERIDLENSKLIERIVSSTGTVNNQKLINSYDSVLSFKKIHSR